MKASAYDKSLSVSQKAVFVAFLSVFVATTIYFTMSSAEATPNVSQAPTSPTKHANGDTKDLPITTKPSTISSPAPSQDQSPKLTGPEIKAQKKAEKAARRAQELQKKQVGPAAPANSGGRPDTAKGPVKAIRDAGKELHKRTGSSTGDQKNVQLRGAQHTQKSTEPPAEDKTVELFRHLYKSRATTIAGVNKDVHPAVLALGQQMRSYVICGSNARLVATLQAFKRVGNLFIVMVRFS